MITHKNLGKISLAVICIAVIITIFFMNGEKFGIIPVVDKDSESYDGPEYVTENDLNGAWDTEDAVAITLTKDSAKIKGNGAYVNGSDVVITNGGYYTVSGSLEGGRLIVDAYKSSKVFIMLDNVSLSCDDDACIRVEEADKVFISLAEGSINTLTGGDEYSEAAIDDGAEAVIFSHDDLTINGTGSLVVNGEYKHGIKANDDFVLTQGSLTITAKEDGIHVNEDVALVDARLTINAGDDAVTTEGTINVDNADILINECYEGLEAKNINVYGGNIEIYPGDDGFNAAGGSTVNLGFAGQGAGNDPAANTDVNKDASVEELPYIRIYDGNIKIINETARDADGLDSNGNIFIEGGNIFISLDGSGSNNAIDFGSESGGECVITGGTLIACGSSNMVEHLSSSSTQASVMYIVSGGVEKGSVISLETSDGDEVLNAEVPLSFSCAIISSPEIVKDGSYRISLGDKTEDITIDEISSSFGDTASMGGQGGRGFMMDGGRNFGTKKGMEQNMGDRPEGGRHGRGTAVSGNGIDMEGMPQPPDMGNTSDGMNGTKPEGMPDGMNGTKPEGMNGMKPEGMPDDMNGAMPQGMGMESENIQAADSRTGFPGKLISEYDTTTIFELIVSLLALGAGLIFAIGYRRRR
ncbi:MAG: carbohydrate-binding domain-containing protein [Lachnospiraceae bacterium]|nr:carbohydrate-binding domain-containing protein [Lachnospiraceae bacterium]